MQNLARGWAIVVDHWHHHAHGLGVAFWILITMAVVLPAGNAWRKRNPPDAEDESLRPKQRAPLPGPDRGFR